MEVDLLDCDDVDFRETDRPLAFAGLVAVDALNSFLELSGSVSSGLRHVPGRHAQSPGEQEVHLYSVLRPVDSLTLPIALVMSGPTSVSVASPQMAS